MTDIASWQVLDLLTGLVDKSLVVYEEDQGRHGRYRLLETLRQYSRDRLMESGGAEATRGRHLEFCPALAQEARPRLLSSEQAHWLDVLEEEHDNLRQALTFCLEEAQGAEPGRRPRRAEQGLRLGATLQAFWATRGHLSEGRERLTALLSLPPAQQRSRIRADALGGAAWLAYDQGDAASSRTLYEESLTISREIGDNTGIATALMGLGEAAFLRGDLGAARSLQEESVVMAREVGNTWIVACCFNNLGTLAYFRRDYASARGLYEQSLTLYRELGNKGDLGAALLGLGNVMRSLGDFAQAGALYRDSLREWQAVGDAGTIGVEGAGGRTHMVRAARLLGAAHSLREAVGQPLPPVDHADYYDQLVGEVQAALGAAAFAAAWTKGQAMSLEQTAEYALASEG